MAVRHVTLNRFVELAEHDIDDTRPGIVATFCPQTAVPRRPIRKSRRSGGG